MALPIQASTVILGCFICLRCGDCERWRCNRGVLYLDRGFSWLGFDSLVRVRLFGRELLL
jgi:hypothetical protein